MHRGPARCARVVVQLCPSRSSDTERVYATGQSVFASPSSTGDNLSTIPCTTTIAVIEELVAMIPSRG